MSDGTDAGGAASVKQPASAAVQAATYTGIVFVLSAPFWIAFKFGHAMMVPVVMLLMWCPAVSAIASTLIFKKPLVRTLGLRWGGWGNAALGYFLPIVYGLIAYGIVWGTQIGEVPNYVFIQTLAVKFHMAGASPLKVVIFTMLAVGVVWELTGGLIAGLGEELGWRGFLTPTLAEKYGWKTASVGTGLIWGVWHWPVILWSTYHSAAPLWYTLVFFTLMTVALSFLFSWLRLRSKSVWPCALLHASHNVWVQAIFTGLTVATAESKWWIDNFGAMVPLVTLVFAAVVVARDGLTATAAQD
jgi:membrane protease YdiL (CAAX protease family)